MYFFLHAILLVRLFFLPLQKMPFQRAADASESCGHCGQIDRSLRPNRAVVKILLHYEKYSTQRSDLSGFYSYLGQV